MAITLDILNDINQLLIDDHKKWLKENDIEGSYFLNALNDNQVNAKDQQYNLLNYPKLWSGSRLFETSIQQTEETKSLGSSVYEKMQEMIANAKKVYKNSPAHLEKIEEFEKKYETYIDTLKVKSLTSAIYEKIETLEKSNQLNDINNKSNLNDIKELFQKKLPDLQTHDDCLMAHRMLTVLCRDLKKSASDKGDVTLKDAIEQIEVLSKRTLDIFYESAKKKTTGEFIVDSLSTTTSSIGLVAGLGAATCALLSLAFPPLLTGAAILGGISMISYVASCASAAKMSYGLLHNRSPSLSEVAFLTLDIALAPLDFGGGKIISSLGRVMKHAKHLVKAIKGLNSLWGNIGSNTIDMIDVKGAWEETSELGSSLIHGKLKGQEATSWRNLRRGLAADPSVSASEAVKLVEEKKQEISELNKQKIKQQNIEKKQNIPSSSADIATKLEHQGRDFALVSINKHNANASLNSSRLLHESENQHHQSAKKIEVTESYHANIVRWQKGFASWTDSSETKAIKEAVKVYKSLDADASLEKRKEALEKIEDVCNKYITKFFAQLEQKGRASKVQTLLLAVKQEKDNLQKHTPGNVILISSKTRLSQS